MDNLNNISEQIILLKHSLNELIVQSQLSVDIIWLILQELENQIKPLKEQYDNNVISELNEKLKSNLISEDKDIEVQ